MGEVHISDFRREFLSNHSWKPLPIDGAGHNLIICCHNGMVPNRSDKYVINLCPAPLLKRESTHPMKSADFVTGRVAQVGQVQLADCSLTYSWGLLASGTAIGETGCVPGMNGLAILRPKTNGAAIAIAGWLTINGFGDREYAATCHVKTTAFVVHRARRVAYNTENSIVKNL